MSGFVIELEVNNSIQMIFIREITALSVSITSEYDYRRNIIVSTTSISLSKAEEHQ